MLKFTLLCNILSCGNPNWINKLTNHLKELLFEFQNSVSNKNYAFITKKTNQMVCVLIFFSIFAMLFVRQVDCSLGKYFLIWEITRY